MKWYGISVKTGEEDYVKNILLNEINNDLTLIKNNYKGKMQKWYHLARLMNY